jgi:excisionase family DNA binding protein
MASSPDFQEHHRERRLGDDMHTPHVTVTEAAELLGVSEATIKRRCQDGTIPAAKPGKEWKIHRHAMPTVDSVGELESAVADARFSGVAPALSAGQTAKLLGVSTYLVLRALDEGTLPAINVGARSRRVDTAELLQLLAAGSVR